MRALALVLGLLPTAVAAAPSVEDQRVCLEQNLTLSLSEVETSLIAHRVIYQATNGLGWTIGGIWLDMVYDGPQGAVENNSVYLIREGLSPGETRQLEALMTPRFWNQELPDTVPISDFLMTVRDVADTDRRLLIGDGMAVHGWPDERTHLECKI